MEILKKIIIFILILLGLKLILTGNIGCHSSKRVSYRQYDGNAPIITRDSSIKFY